MRFVTCLQCQEQRKIEGCEMNIETSTSILTSLLNTDEVNSMTNTDNPDISDITVLSIAKMRGHKTSLSGSLMRLVYAVSNHASELTSPSRPLGDSYLEN